MKIAIAGGSGFVGKALSHFFLKNGDEVCILTRKPKSSINESNFTYIEWLNDKMDPTSQLEGVDIIINLAGESINSGRWNNKRKSRILNSRLTATNTLLQIIEKLKVKPKALINASGIGYYGTSRTMVFTEDSNSIGDDFLSETVKQWESVAIKAEELGVRTVLCRFGIVLANDVGALPKIALPYRLFAGGKLGSGQQWVSWIHIKDVVSAIYYVIQNEAISGPVNFISPHPVQMNEFGMVLGKLLHRPHWLQTHEFALKLLLGEMSMLLLDGQRVLPQKLMDHGFIFQFPTLNTALENIFQN